MRAISSFKLEAGISTFWCRARSALRIRASMSATGSVNFIVLLLLGHPFSPPQAENQRWLLTINYSRPWSLVLSRWLFHCATIFDQRPTTNDRGRVLPRRLRNSRNLSPQRQPAETQAANAELAEIRTRTSANLAAVMLARGELGLLHILRFNLALRTVFHSFCCSCHLASSS